jgi:hypothetical protein
MGKNLEKRMENPSRIRVYAHRASGASAVEAIQFEARRLKIGVAA